MSDAKTLDEVTGLALNRVHKIEFFTLAGLIFAFAFSLATNLVIWWMIHYLLFKVQRTIDSLHEKIALADDLYRRRLIPEKILFTLCHRAGASFVQNEYEICSKIQSQHEEIRRRGGTPRILVYSPEEVREFHSTKHQLWECVSDSHSPLTESSKRGSSGDGVAKEPSSSHPQPSSNSRNGRKK